MKPVVGWNEGRLRYTIVRWWTPLPPRRITRSDWLVCRAIMGGVPGGWSIGGAGVGTAAPPSYEAATFEGLLWLGALLVVVSSVAVVLVYLRRRTRRPGQPTEPSFTLEDLRRLRDEGTVSTTEYEALRDKMVQGLKEAAGPGE
jgi:hypothetical protein